ncbi:MAG: hypothetical protein RLZZ371_2808, partial [Pseudomonadota bacterium]
MLHPHAVESICHASHGDPFSVLGPHALGTGKTSVRCFLPHATQVTVVNADDVSLGTLKERASGFFEGQIKAAPSESYRLQVLWADGHNSLLEDPYRFPMVLGDMDVWLLGEGTHLRPFEVLGGHPDTMLGVAGTRFAVWAPNASRVSVIGDFNFWDGRRHPMRLRRECGVWELFLPGVKAGSLYKFEVRTQSGEVLSARSDPYALQAELRPATASVVRQLPAKVTPSSQRQAANALDAPVSIYEVHLGSWRRITEDGNRWLNWDE